MSNPAAEAIEGRVLVVDDDRGFQGLVTQLLGQEGVETVCVRTGEEALRLCENDRPRAVVLDGLLPGMRGDEVARRLRRIYAPAQLPIVFVSAFFRDVRSYEQLGSAGVTAILHKPVDPEHLRRTLLGALGESSEGDEIDVEEEGVRGPEMAQLLSEYLADSRARTRGMIEAVGNLGEPGRMDVRRMIRTEAHRLRGSGASFGIPEISRLAGEIEDLLGDFEADDPLPEPGRARLAGLAEALLRKVDEAAGAAPLPARRPPELPPAVYLLDEATSELSTSFSVLAGATDRVRSFTSTSDLIQAATRLRPDAVLVADEPPFGLDALKTLRGAGLSTLLLMSASSETSRRVLAVRAGAEGYVPRPPDAHVALSVAASFVRPSPGTRVLAVHGDRALLAAAAESLAPHGVAVEPCPDPAQVFAAIEATRPELVMVDLDLPGLSGVELVRVLRADPALRRLPLLVVATRPGPSDRIAAYSAGADDFLAPPLPDGELPVRVLSHLRRKLVLDRDPGVDPHTGVPGPKYLVEACERALALARRGGRSLGLLGLDAGFEELAREHGRLAAETAIDALAAHLRASFRSSDLVARIAPGRLAVLLHDVVAHDAERLLVVELAAFGTRTFTGPNGPFRPALKGALVTFPEHTGAAREVLAELEIKLAAGSGRSST